jgi:hypothetical protein
MMIRDPVEVRHGVQGRVVCHSSSLIQNLEDFKIPQVGKLLMSYSVKYLKRDEIRSLNLAYLSTQLKIKEHHKILCRKLLISLKNDLSVIGLPRKTTINYLQQLKECSLKMHWDYNKN